MDCDLTRYFLEGIEKDKLFYAMFNLARLNSSGNIWVVGSTVYRTIISEMYKEVARRNDFDFIVERIAPQLCVPVGWESSISGGGSPRMKGCGFQIDLVPLDNAVDEEDKSRRGTMRAEEKLESYFRRAPLSVQALAFDFGQQKIIGDIGMEAICKRQFRVCNQRELEGYCQRHGINIDQYFNIKVGDLGFKFEEC